MEQMRYFLQVLNWEPREVSEADFRKAEAEAGFKSKTGGFTSGIMRGFIEYPDPVDYVCKKCGGTEQECICNAWK